MEEQREVGGAVSDWQLLSFPQHSHKKNDIHVGKCSDRVSFFSLEHWNIHSGCPWLRILVLLSLNVWLRGAGGQTQLSVFLKICWLQWEKHDVAPPPHEARTRCTRVNCLVGVVFSSRRPLHTLMYGYLILRQFSNLLCWEADYINRPSESTRVSAPKKHETTLRAPHIPASLFAVKHTSVSNNPL